MHKLTILILAVAVCCVFSKPAVKTSPCVKKMICSVVPGAQPRLGCTKIPVGACLESLKKKTTTSTQRTVATTQTKVVPTRKPITTTQMPTVSTTTVKFNGTRNIITAPENCPPGMDINLEGKCRQPF